MSVNLSIGQVIELGYGFDPNLMHWNYKLVERKEFSRYPNSLEMKYRPYDLSPEMTFNARKHIKLVPGKTHIVINDVDSPVDLWESSLLSVLGNDSYLLEPKRMHNLMHNGSLTPLGYLAFLFRRNYGNEDFKRYVEEELNNSWFEYELDETKYWFVADSEIMFKQLEFINETSAEPEETILHFPYIFNWRD